MIKVPVVLCLSILVSFTSCSRFSSQSVTPAPAQPAAPEMPAQNGWDPTQACGFLSEKLRPGQYRNEGGSVFGCMSTARNIGVATPVPNNIVYHVRGDTMRARQVRLILNVNDVAGANDAQKVLLEYSEALSLKALGVTLSRAAAEAIARGTGGSGRVGTTKVEVLRHDFSSGNGYELHFVITPRL